MIEVEQYRKALELLQQDLGKLKWAGAVMQAALDVVEQDTDKLKWAGEVMAAALEVKGGEWCAKNRAEGRGGCGACTCAWCCKQADDRADVAEARLRSADLTKRGGP